MKKLTAIVKERINFCSTFLNNMENGHLSYPCDKSFLEKQAEFTEAKINWKKLLYYIENNSIDSNFKDVFQYTMIKMLAWNVKDLSIMKESNNWTEHFPNVVAITQETISDLEEAINEAKENWKDALNADDLSIFSTESIYSTSPFSMKANFFHEKL